MKCQEATYDRPLPSLKNGWRFLFSIPFLVPSSRSGKYHSELSTAPSQLKQPRPIVSILGAPNPELPSGDGIPGHRHRHGSSGSETQTKTPNVGGCRERRVTVAVPFKSQDASRGPSNADKQNSEIHHLSETLPRCFSTSPPKLTSVTEKKCGWGASNSAGIARWRRNFALSYQTPAHVLLLLTSHT